MVVVYLGRHVGRWTFTATICGKSGCTDQRPPGRRTNLTVHRRLLFHARNLDYLKFKKPNAPAVKREADEDWGRR